MNTSNIKKYAPMARKQFRDAVMQKLTTLGIEVDKKDNLQITQPTDLGDRVRYGQFSLDKPLASRRERLVKRAEKQGYEVLVEHIAYTWFNRFCAIRYMELHGYLDHGFRMLSHPTLEGGFEVLDHVPEVADALGLSKSHLVEMKLAGDRDEELYRELLLAQCHALHGAMPFLFEAVNDDIELVLPDNLTRTDSILRGLVDTIPEEDWEQVEVIGWLYQFYISEKKDEVIGKVVKSEDIPAATQLFTPNWIVQYLVQNSVGRQWLQTYPDSSLKDKMPYYIEPAEQTQEVQVQLSAITPLSIEPESIKVLDPACGSGHILTEAYNVLKAIYEERGYRTRDIPQLILENNIFGLDIDDRAAQLSGFAMLMLARQDDRRILSRSVRLNIVSLQESKLNIAELWTKLNFHQQVQHGSMGDMFAEDMALANTDSAEYKLLIHTLALFSRAKTLGSLIQVPQEDEAALKTFLDGLYLLAVEGDNQQKEAAVELIPYIQQAWILAQCYDAVVANPPYLGNRKGMNDGIKDFADKYFPESKGDTFSLFVSKAQMMTAQGSYVAMITLDSWLTLVTYKEFREKTLQNSAILDFLHNPYEGKKPTVMGINFGTVAFVLMTTKNINLRGDFIRLRYLDLQDDGTPKKVFSCSSMKNTIESKNFGRLPSCSIVYAMNSSTLDSLSNSKLLSEQGEAREGMATADNERYVRWWFELHFNKIAFNISDAEFALDSDARWFPYIKGGEFRKWSGNFGLVVDWENDGERIKNNIDPVTKRIRSHNYNGEYGFKSGMTWTSMSSKGPSARYVPSGYMFDAKGPMFYSSHKIVVKSIALMNSLVGAFFLDSLSTTKDFKIGQILSLPMAEKLISDDTVVSVVEELVGFVNYVDSFNEQSWGFGRLILKTLIHSNSSRDFSENLLSNLSNVLDKIEYSENLINEKMADYYEVGSELGSYSYTRSLQIDDVINSPSLNLISYCIGCQMGRYSLDREGLVYAHEGNKGFSDLAEKGVYKSFPADDDGIVPLMDSDWLDDDVTARVKEFVRTVWGEVHLQENLEFIAESLCLYAIKPKKGESSFDTIRRYLSTQFWKDHMKMYKKRPIYWLFSSGKEKAFECLVYLHRYNEGTLSRMRTEYVVPLLARYQGNIDLVNDQLKNAESGAATTRLKKELDGLTKKFNELRSFDDRLRHYAERRITIDLNDGVKVNYGRFGDLLADVKAITGSAPEEI
ncbi:BREX-1 system adenine-specific DNA-methyltransferase PglX [Providencia heimbachae]|uniref:BREX-1 system adenine-specific DNA-methyltransferase PglX n=1 Tax=Providencia heimbachae TaxID=333962 RepID=UPI0010BEC4F2|nr:BREX-1 system adenine-specific DNA-methyltransferase PglX [Providencia heimbachae]QCJ71571.1 BREX-1 system adenine-specific DNA-methyltransferase PglX [Providencia heimbachae]